MGTPLCSLHSSPSGVMQLSSCRQLDLRCREEDASDDSPLPLQCAFHCYLLPCRLCAILHQHSASYASQCPESNKKEIGVWVSLMCSVDTVKAIAGMPALEQLALQPLGAGATGLAPLDQVV